MSCGTWDFSQSLLLFADRTVTFFGGPFQTASAKQQISYSVEGLQSFLDDPSTLIWQRLQA